MEVILILISMIIALSKGDSSLDVKTKYLKVGFNENTTDYYIDIMISNQLQRMIIDIKSELTAVVCKDYQKILVPDNIFHYNLLQPQNIEDLECMREECTFVPSFDDECEEEIFCIFKSDDIHLQGFFYVENHFSLFDFYEDEKSKRFTLGCIENAAKSFVSPNTTENANGVLGLGSTEVSFAATYLYSNDLPRTEGMFSLCLGDKDGLFQFGRLYEEEAELEDYYSAPYGNIHDVGYEIKINGIAFTPKTRVQGENKTIVTIGISYGILNSRAQEITFPVSIFNDFYSTLKEITEKVNLEIFQSEFGICVNKTKKEVDALLPNVEFTVEQSEIYLLKDVFEEIENNTCIRVKNSTVSNNQIMLGQVFLKHHKIIFDKYLRKIYFKESTCKTEKPFCKVDKVKFWKVNGFFLGVIFCLVTVIVIMGIAIVRLRKEKSFLCFYSDKDELEKNMAKAFINTEYFKIS